MRNPSPIRLAPSATAEQVAANLRYWRGLATAEQVAEGADWYPANGVAIAAIASEAFDFTGDYVSPDMACAIFAAYSQNATWKANVTMATRYLNGSGPFGLANVQRECAAIEDAADPLSVDLGLKRTAFAANLAGDLRPVTCDRWHIEAGYGQRRALDTRIRDTLQAATELVAAEYGEQPAETQAIIWCAIRGDGK
jgi:hypothetical protein